MDHEPQHLLERSCDPGDANRAGPAGLPLDDEFGAGQPRWVRQSSAAAQRRLRPRPPVREQAPL